MIDLSLWQDRLEAAATDLKKIGLATDVVQAREELKQDPAAFIVLGSERAARNDVMNEVIQTVTVNVAVIIAVKHSGSRTGARNIDQLKLIRDQIDPVFLGWMPDDANEQVEYVSGRLLEFNNQVLWWIDLYATEYTKHSV